jgi:eukaryotic-like serine/threonine-protein kinase
MNLRTLFHELRRRRVFRVLGFYAVAGWVAIQVAATTFPYMNLPDWTVRLVIVLFIVGIPAVAALAWLFDVTPGGVVRADRAMGRAAAASPVMVRVGALALLVFVTAGGYASLRYVRPAAGTLDAGLVAILPFRVAGADASVAYLREGMLDLLSAKLTGEAGPRAVDARTLVSAWRRSAGDDAADLPRERALDLARTLGAGRLVLGEVVSMPGRIVLTASLSDVGSGRTRPAVSVEGTPEELSSLVDRLVIALLSVGAGEDQRLASLTTTSLPALRAYLDGQAAYRGGRYDAAFTHFVRAVETDTTFALAAFMVSRAAGWILDERRGMFEPALALAWRHRERLGERDRAILAAVAGPNYPGYSNTRERITALEALVRARPEDSEAWFWLSDEIFHGGGQIDMGDVNAQRRVVDGFERVLRLDSLHLPAFHHLFDIASLRGDTAAAARYAAQYLARDSVGLTADLIRSVRAVQTRGLAAAPQIVARIDSAGLQLATYMITLLSADPAHLPVADRVVDHLLSPAADPELALRATGIVYNHLMNAGRHADADRIMAHARRMGQRDSLNVLVTALRDGLHWDGDRADADAAAAALMQQFDNLPAGRPVSGLICALGQWHLARGEPREAVRYIDELRARFAANYTDGEVAAMRCAEMIDVWRVALERAPDADLRIARFDSLMFTGNAIGRSNYEANLVLARLHEERGNLAAALRALRRTPLHIGELSSYGSTFIRERGRVAELLGDTATAVASYRHYLAMRENADARFAEEVADVRAALLRLTGGERK